MNKGNLEILSEIHITKRKMSRRRVISFVTKEEIRTAIYFSITHAPIRVNGTRNVVKVNAQIIWRYHHRRGRKCTFLLCKRYLQIVNYVSRTLHAKRNSVAPGLHNSDKKSEARGQNRRRNASRTSKGTRKRKIKPTAVSAPRGRIFLSVHRGEG